LARTLEIRGEYVVTAGEVSNNLFKHRSYRFREGQTFSAEASPQLAVIISVFLAQHTNAVFFDLVPCRSCADGEEQGNQAIIQSAPRHEESRLVKAETWSISIEIALDVRGHQEERNKLETKRKRSGCLPPIFKE